MKLNKIASYFQKMHRSGSCLIINKYDKIDKTGSDNLAEQIEDLKKRKIIKN